MGILNITPDSFSDGGIYIQNNPNNPNNPDHREISEGSENENIDLEKVMREVKSMVTSGNNLIYIYFYV